MMDLKIGCKSMSKTYHIGDIVKDVKITTERSGSATKLSFDLVKSGEINYLEGDYLKFSMPNTNGKMFDMFSGYIFKKSKSLDVIATTAYDQLRYLKAKQSYNISGMKVGDVIRMIAADFDLKVGYIEDTGYVLPEKIYENKTLFDIITECVSLSVIAKETVYVFYDDFGKLTLKRAQDMQNKYIIGDKSFATDYTYETSIEEAYNYIKLIRKNKESGNADAYIAKDSTAIADWGKLQFYETVDENLNAAQIEEMTRHYLDYYCQRHRKLKLTAVGIPELRAGSMITIDIVGLGDVNLNKMLLVDKCTHNISSNSHTMDLEMRVYNG